MLVPVVLSGVFAYWSVSAQAHRNADRSLHEAAKGFALEALGRLQLASELLRAVEQNTASANEAASAGANAALGRVVLIAAGETSPALPESVGQAILARARSDHGSAETRVVFVPTAGDAPATYLIQQVMQGESRGRFVVAEVPRDFLWGTQEVLRSGYQYCVLVQRNLLVFCSQAALGRQLLALRNASRGEIPGSFAYLDGEDRSLAASWSLPSAQGFAKLELDVAAGGQEAMLLATVVAFRNIVAPALGATLLTAVWIAIILVRRRMQPLDELVVATDRLAGGDFSSRVQVQSDDEFAGVGRAFNAMQSILGRQFAELGALSKLDRLILERGSLDAIAEDTVGEVASFQPDGTATIVLRDLDAGCKTVAYWTDGKKVEVLRGVMDQLLLDQLEGLSSSAYPQATMAALERLGLAQHAFGPTQLFPIRDGETIVGAISVSMSTDHDEREPQQQLARQFADRLSVAAASIRQRERLYALGHFDDLTGLPNRQLFKERLNQALNRAASTGNTGHLLYIDLDRFKQVNDAEGHRTGDRLLCAAAERIVSCVRDVDTVARLSGDEFTVLIADGVDSEEVENIGRRIVEVLQQPFRLQTLEYFIAGSVGAACFPDDGETVDQILRNADLAMYSAKDGGGCRMARYERGMQAFAQERVEEEAALRHAIENGEMCLYYQPQIEVGSGRISGVEALLRWQRPGVGLVAPSSFIPLAEHTGLIRELGAFSLERACRDFVTWRSAGLELDTMSVNVSLRELKEPGFEAQLARILHITGMPHNGLELEITESVLAEDVIRASERLRRIHSLGVAIAIDDFGTGYSSFTYLRDFPVDTLKIDQTFVRDVPSSAGAASLLESIIDMARRLGKNTVAEGVETPEQARFLEKCQCAHLQGYLFAKPLPEVEFLAYARARSGLRLQSVA
jgi:diguanylate cyclase (GGDEF)-like protein